MRAKWPSGRRTTVYSWPMNHRLNSGIRNKFFTVSDLFRKLELIQWTLNPDIKIIIQFPGIFAQIFRNRVVDSNMRGWFTPKMTLCVNLITIALAYANLIPVKLILDGFLVRTFFPIQQQCCCSTHKISIKMFQTHQRIFWEYSQNFRGRPIHDFAHATVGDFYITLNGFQSWFYSTIKIWVKFIWIEIPKIPGIQPIYSKNFYSYHWYSGHW